MKLKKIIADNLFMLKNVFQYTPLYVLFAFFEGIGWGFVSSYTSVVFLKQAVDMIEKGEDFGKLLTVSWYLIAANLALFIFNIWYWQYYKRKVNEDLNAKMQSHLFKQALKLDLSCYDNPKFYDDFVWSMSEVDTRTAKVLNDAVQIISYLISIGVIAGVIFTIDPLILVVIFLSVFLSMFSNARLNKINYERDKEQNPLSRKNSYIQRVFYQADFAKEIRLSKIEDSLLDEYKQTNKSIIKILMRYAGRISRISFFNYIISNWLYTFGFFLLLVYKIMVEKSITLGDFAASMSAIGNLAWRFRAMLTDFTKFQEHSLYADRLRKFWEYKPKIHSLENPVNIPETPQAIELKNVTFGYEGEAAPTLKNISLKINPYEKIALVGHNGAGKTTLIKLLMRLYDPDEGEIIYGGQNVKNYDIDSYRLGFGSVFQDCKIFAATIAENVACSAEYDRPAVVDALEKSGFREKLDTLPEGIDTPLTREYHRNGTLLSGGEAQKIAIARVFYKKCMTAILDEPASGLDPIAEYHLNQSMLNAARDKTIIFISHRLSSTVMADRIFLLENGEIIEAGSHTELMALDRKYARMFRMQAEKYQAV